MSLQDVNAPKNSIIMSKNTTYRNSLNFIFYVPLTCDDNSALLPTHRWDKLRGTRGFFEVLQIVIVIIKEDTILALLFPSLLLMPLGRRENRKQKQKYTWLMYNK